MVSLGSVVSGMIAVVLLSIYGYFFITHIKRPIYRDMRFLIFLLFIAGIRMLLPINLPVNITIPSSTFLIPTSEIIYIQLPVLGLKVYQVIVCIWLIVAIILLFTKAIRYHLFINNVKQFTYTDITLDKLLSERELNNRPNRISALYTDARVSPFVFGLVNPVIVIPDKEYSEEELIFVLDHELTHINQNDLFLKWLFNVLTAVFWWNPFIWMIRKQADNAIELSNDISLYEEMNESEKADYAALLVKTASFSTQYESQHSLSLSTHNDPILKQRVNDLINDTKPQHTLLAVHIILMLLIVSVSFLVTPEPFSIHEDQIDGSYDLEEDRGSTEDNTYIIDNGKTYELYVGDEMIGEMDEIPDEFRGYPVYKEKPGEGE